MKLSYEPARSFPRCRGQARAVQPAGTRGASRKPRQRQCRDGRPALLAQHHRRAEPLDAVHQPSAGSSSPPACRRPPPARAADARARQTAQRLRSTSTPPAPRVHQPRSARQRLAARRGGRTPRSSAPITSSGALRQRREQLRPDGSVEIGVSTTRSGCFAGGGSVRASSSGSSARAVPAPTITASCAARSLCTSARAASPVIQRLSPDAVAMRPSSDSRQFQCDVRAAHRARLAPASRCAGS